MGWQTLELAPFAVVKVFPRLLRGLDQFLILCHFISVLNRVNHAKLTKVCPLKFVTFAYMFLNFFFSFFGSQLDFFAGDHALLDDFFALMDPFLLALGG